MRAIEKLDRLRSTMAVNVLIINIYFLDGLTGGIIWTENKETKTLLAFSYEEGKSNKSKN